MKRKWLCAQKEPTLQSHGNHFGQKLFRWSVVAEYHQDDEQTSYEFVQCAQNTHTKLVGIVGQNEIDNSGQGVMN